MEADNKESMEHRIADRTDFLLDRMTSDFGLINKLFARQILTKAELHNVKLSSNTTEAKNKIILDVAITKGKAKELVETLGESGQMHLVNYLSAKGAYNPEFGDDWPLAETTLLRLQINHESLVDLLDTNNLCDRLFSASTINMRQMQFIRSRQTDWEKNEALLDMMSQFSIRQYKQTINCLHSSNQRHVADVFSKGGAVVRIHANLEGMIADVDAAENEIITSVTYLLRDKTPTEAIRLSGLAQLGLLAARKGESVVFYFQVMTKDEHLHLKELLISGKLKKSLEKLINHLLFSGNTVKVTLTWSQEELSKSLSCFGEDLLNINKKIQPEQEAFKTNMQVLPKEVMDMILMKAIHAMALNTDYGSCSLNGVLYEIVTQLQNVSYEWNKSLTMSWMKKKIRFIRNHLPKIDYKLDPVFKKTFKTNSIQGENNNWIRGLTILDKELFILNRESSVVEVYDSMELSFRRRFELEGLINPWDMESCNRNKCVYIADWK